METEIVHIKNEDEIASCFDVFKVLRPHLDKQRFMSQVLRQKEQSFQIIVVKARDKICSAAGYRFSEHLAWGKILYVDDLITLPECRGNGFAALLIDHLISIAKDNDCQQLHLDTGHQRHSAHKLYLKKGMSITSHHVSMDLKVP